MSLHSYIDKARFALARARSGDSRYDVETYRTLANMRQWRGEDIILDVGANDGRTILRWRRHLPATRILAFEPVRSTFQTLTERTKDLPDIKLFQCALGALAERRTIYLDNQSALNSFYAERTNASGAEEVEVDTLDAVIEREGIDRVQLLKIDAEGHDLDVLQGATSALSEQKFEIIQVEASFDLPEQAGAPLWDFHALLSPH